MSHSKFTLEEKASYVVSKLNNLVEIDLIENKVSFRCPICDNVWENTIQETWTRIHSKKEEVFEEDDRRLTCCKKHCSVKQATKRKSTINKMQETCMKRYGKKSNLSTEESLEKSRQGIIKNHGSYKEMHKKNWKKYEERTGYSHNMRNPESIKLNQKHRVETILNMTKEQKENWFNHRLETHKKNGTYLWGGKTPTSSNCSKLQLEFFNLLQRKIPYNILYGRNEKTVWVNKKNYYIVDGYISEKNIVIEFYGDYWHANPKVYNEDKIIKYFKGNLISKEVWEHDDKRKNEIVNKLNCKFIVVWEKDYCENKESIINNIIEEIHS